MLRREHETAHLHTQNLGYFGLAHFPLTWVNAHTLDWVICQLIYQLQHCTDSNGQPTQSDTYDSNKQK